MTRPPIEPIPTCQVCSERATRHPLLIYCDGCANVVLVRVHVANLTHSLDGFAITPLERQLLGTRAERIPA